ncbi:glycosyltransferase family 2 protein [Siccirubricoccus deserti]
MAAAATRCLVLIPSYNTGGILLETVRGARSAWAPVWVVIDGSTDGSDVLLGMAMQDDPQFRLITLPANSGKGTAVLAGLREAAAAGFTHALVMDADGQHPADAIGTFMAAAAAEPAALILGRPVFGPEAPQLRVRGRRISNWWAISRRLAQASAIRCSASACTRLPRCCRSCSAAGGCAASISTLRRQSGSPGPACH